MNNILIIGLGLIGGSIAKGLNSSQLDLKIFASDKNPSSISSAIDDRIISMEIDINDLKSIKENDIDLIIISTPTSSIRKILKEFESSGVLNSNITITDTASAKSELINEFKDVKNLVLSHPMSGSDESGYSASTSNLFKNKKTIVIDSFDADEKHLRIVNRLWETLGSTSILMEAMEHDKAMAYASHLPHLISFALMHSIMKEDNSNINDFAAGGLKEFLRIAGSDPKMWADIFSSNHINILNSLNEFKNSIDEIQDKFSDFKDLEDFISNIKAYKQKSF